MVDWFSAASIQTYEKIYEVKIVGSRLLKNRDNTQATLRSKRGVERAAEI